MTCSMVLNTPLCIYGEVKLEFLMEPVRNALNVSVCRVYEYLPESGLSLEK